MEEKKEFVGMRGFEPPTPPTPRECAIRAAPHSDI